MSRTFLTQASGRALKGSYAYLKLPTFKDRPPLRPKMSLRVTMCERGPAKIEEAGSRSVAAPSRRALFGTVRPAVLMPASGPSGFGPPNSGWPVSAWFVQDVGEIRGRGLTSSA